MITIYTHDETNFNNNGLGVLNNCITATTEEEKNGKYELYIEYPLMETKCAYFLKRNIIKADGQLFRIYKVGKESDKMIATINARHIFYDLNFEFIEDSRAVNTTCQGAIDKLLYGTRFIGYSDIVKQDTAYFVEANPDTEIFNKVLPQWGGELLRDNFTVNILANRGINRGVLLKGGKNIHAIKELVDTDYMVTRGYFKGKDGLTLPEKYITSDSFLDYPVTKKVEFQDIEDETSLRIAGQNYLDQYSKPFISWKVDMIELSSTEQYKDYQILEKIYLCDYVYIDYSDFELPRTEVQVIRIKKDLLLDINTEVVLGEPLLTIYETMNNVQNTANGASALLSRMLTNNNRLNPSYMAEMINLATTMIQSNEGKVIMNDNGIYITDTGDLNTAQDVWKWGMGGLGHSSTGVNGPYTTAITSDGKIVANFISTGILKGGFVEFNLESGTLLIGNSLEDYQLYFDGTDLWFGGGAIKWANLDASTKDNISNYTVTITSDNGAVFKNGDIQTVLRARVYKGIEDVTDEYDSSRFRWKRVSSDSAGDTAWNNAHFGGTKSVNVYPADVNIRATFTCDIL